MSALALACLLAAPPGPSAEGPDRVRAYVRANETAILRELADLLALPNLASDGEGIRRNADAIVRLLERRGMKARLLDGEGGPPAILGTLEATGARRTVVFYAHYDGQPVEPAKWATAPWSPVLRDGPLESGGKVKDLDATPRGPDWRLYARSAGDDKAPVVGFLAALDALRAARLPLSVNLKLFFDGEEEAGSPHLPAILGKNREALRGDAWIFCDGPVHPSRRPLVYFGARGVTDFEMTVYGPLRPLHSGHYGNWAPNPAAILAEIVSGMRDSDGRIRIAGYYDDVRPPSAAEKSALAVLPEEDAAAREELALAATEGGGASRMERILLPALNVRGLAAGAVGASTANAIPTEATASIDLRLVPDQTPARARSLVEAHLAGLGYTIVRETPTADARRATPKLLKLVWGPGYPACRADMASPFSKAILAVAQEAAGGRTVAIPTSGGSIPMYVFPEIFGVPLVGLPIANHDDNQHAANENLRLQNLWDGIELYAALYARLGAVWK